MIKSLARNILKNELVQKDDEIKELKQKLQYRHTTINDLRYKTKILEQLVSENVHVLQDEFRQGSGVARKVRLLTKSVSDLFSRRHDGPSV